MDDSLRKSKTDFLLEGFTDKELKGFDLFVRSKSDKADVFNFWKDKYSDILKSRKFSEHGKSQLPKKRPKKTYSRKFLSDFNKVIEAYYIRNAVDRDEQGRMIYLLRELRIRNMDKLFNELLKDIKKYNRHKVLKGYVHNITMLRSYYEEYFLFNALNAEDSMLKLCSDINDISQNILLQKTLFENINRKLYGVGDIPDSQYLVPYDKVIGFISSKLAYYKSYHENIYVMYLLSVLIDRSGDEKEIRNLLNFLKNNSSKFTIDFLKHIYDDIFRYMVLRINQGKRESLVLAYETIKDIDKRGLIKKMSHIQPMNFFAVINISTHLGEFAFAEKFIRDYNRKLAQVHREDVTRISRAMIEFAKGNFSLSKSLLYNIKVKNLALYLFAKTTLMKSLYEKNELRVISSISDTLKHFLNRKKEVTDVYKKSIFKFLSYINRLSYAKRTYGKGLSQISDDISSEKSFFQKKWIEDKLEKLRELYIMN